MIETGCLNQCWSVFICTVHSFCFSWVNSCQQGLTGQQLNVIGIVPFGFMGILFILRAQYHTGAFRNRSSILNFKLLQLSFFGNSTHLSWSLCGGTPNFRVTFNINYMLPKYCQVVWHGKINKFSTLCLSKAGDWWQTCNDISMIVYFG